jgi:hypothetical protein
MKPSLAGVSWDGSKMKWIPKSGIKLLYTCPEGPRGRIEIANT